MFMVSLSGNAELVAGLVIRPGACLVGRAVS